MHTRAAVAIPPQQPQPHSFLTSVPSLAGAHVGLPAVFGTPHAAFGAAADASINVASGREGEAPAVNADHNHGRDVSWHEYQRVCTNENALMENVETLKALVLQLAAQLNQAQGELQLIERSSISHHPPHYLPSDTDSHESTKSAPPAISKAKSCAGTDTVKEADASEKELLEVIARKDRVIDVLQRRLATQHKQFHALLDHLAREKDTIIERLAMELDTATRRTR